LKVFWARFSTI